MASMLLRQKIQDVLASLDGCCLDDREDRERVLDALCAALDPQHPLEFFKACERLRWSLRNGAIAGPPDKADVQILLKALDQG